MIITVDPTNSEDIAAFAMVKQYNLQNAIAEIAATEWSTISGSTRVTCTKTVSPASGGGIMYAGDNICAIVSYALEGNNYDVASQAGVIVDSVSLANDTDIVYTVVFSADEMPTSTVKLNLIIYGDKMIGQETGEPVSAEEITAQVLSTINGRLTNLESGLLINDSVAKLGNVTAGTDTKPIKLVAGVPTAVTDTLAKDNAVVKLTGDQSISGIKTFNSILVRQFTGSGQNVFRLNNSSGNSYLYSMYDTNNKYRGYMNHQCIINGDLATRLLFNTQSPDYDSTAGTGAIGGVTTELIPDGKYELKIGRTKGNGDSVSVQIAKILANGTVQSGLLDSYETMVRTANAQTIGGVKTFTDAPAFIAPTTIATAKMSRKITDAVSENTYSYIDFLDGANNRIGVIGSRIMNNPDGLSTVDRGVYLQPGNQGNLYVNTNGSALVAGIRNQRAYATGNTEDIVTIGTLKASTDVVHTSGAETIAGAKTYTSPITINGGATTQYALYMKLTGVATKESTPATTALNALDWNATNGDEIGALFMRFNTNGTRELNCNMIKSNGSRVSRSLITIDSTGEYMTGPYRSYDPTHTTDVATIGTLDAYTPMVRTTGNQSIGGVKRFTGRNVNAGQIMTASASAGGKWFKVATMPKQAGAVSRTMLFMFDNAAYSTGWWGMFIMSFGATTFLPVLKWIIKSSSWTTDVDSVAVGSSGGFWEIWLRSNASNHKAAISLIDLCTEVWNQEYALTLIDPTQQTEESAPTSDTTINYIS